MIRFNSRSFGIDWADRTRWVYIVWLPPEFSYWGYRRSVFQSFGLGRLSFDWQL